MMLSWPALAVILYISGVSAFTVHQHSEERKCVDLQCPVAAFENGVKNLVNDETMQSDKCTSCQQCTENGYSTCLHQKDSRAHRTSSESGGFCSCSHSVPTNCHNRLNEKTHPANITMKLFSVCYLSAIQAPPKPLAVNEKNAVIVTVEAFWHEPYWREITMENLTLHYEFPVTAPEHCEGDVITSDNEHVEHICKHYLSLNMTSSSEESAKDNDEYEHSENYDQYDDDLPPEVQFDRDIFDGSKLLKAFYTVDVRRPRQMDLKTGDAKDQTTVLESEVLKFDLKPEIFGTGIPEVPTEDSAKEDPESATETRVSEEDVSEEKGELGTDFFDETKVHNPKSIEEEEKEDKEDEEELEKKMKEEEEEEEKEEETTDEGEKTDAAVDGISDDDEKEEKEDEETETSTTADDKEEEEKEDNEEDKEEDKEGDKEEKDEETEEDGEKEDSEKEEEKTEDDKDDEESSKEGDEEEASGSGDEPEEDEGFYARITSDKAYLGRFVFGITILAVFLLILCVCCFRHGRRCCESDHSKTTVNGCRYTNPNRGELVSQQPEKECLRQ